MFSYADVAERVLQVETSAQEDWRASYISKEHELVELTKRFSSADETISQMGKDLGDAQVKIRSLHEELERSKKELAALKEAETKKVEASFKEGFGQGGRNFRDKFFVSAQGQEFLKIVRDGLIKDYLCFPACLEDLSRAYGFLAEDIGRNAARALGVTEEQIAEFDFDCLIRRIDNPGLIAAMGIDGSLPEDHAWWLATFEKVVHYFMHLLQRNTWLAKLPFPLAALTPLQEAIPQKLEARGQALRA